MSVVSLLGCSARLGADDEAESTTSTGSEANHSSFVTESDDDWQPSGEPTPYECVVDGDCEPGNCIDYECVVCNTDADCVDMAPCMGATCNAGTCDVDICPTTGCHESWCDSVCRYAFCAIDDGVVDMELRIVAHDFVPSPDLDVGAEIRVLGLRGCGEVTLVRDLDDDELILFASEGMALDPTALSYASLLATMELDEALLEPLAIDVVDPALCPPELDTCATFSRGSLAVAHAQGAAQVLDGTLGWAPGGYRVSANALRFEQEPNDCGRASTHVFDFMIARDACQADCPAPIFESQCVAPLDPRPANRVELEFTFAEQVAWDRWDFDCRVLAATIEAGELDEVEHVRALDCVARYQPDLELAPSWCSG
jgi:hypothetical protein